MTGVVMSSWNVQECSSQNLLPSETCVDLLSRVDIAFLQEVPDSSSGISALSAIFKGCKNSVVWMLEPSVTRKGGSMGLAIMSRYPVGDITRLIFESPGWRPNLEERGLSEHPKGAIIASIAMPGRIVKVACLHLLPPHVFDLDELSVPASGYLTSCLDQLLDIAPTLEVIAGDFNSELNGYELKIRGFTDCASGCVTRDSGRSHDNIGAREEFGFSGFDVLSTGSDHHALVCNFKL